MGANSFRILVASDMHHAGPLEKLRTGRIPGDQSKAWQRFLLRPYRKYVWLDDPRAHNSLLDAFLDRAGQPDLVVANGDFACNSAYLGMCDDAAFESAQICLGRLRDRFQGRLLPVIGDHELGKKSIIGGYGGLRLESWERTLRGLEIPPLWTYRVGRYVLLSVTSSLLAFPIMESESLIEERQAWWELRRLHLLAIQTSLESLQPGDQWILFCHDPTALPFLLEEPSVRSRLPQLYQTWIGHLHSPLVLQFSHWLRGIPPLHGLGPTFLRISQALRKANAWRPFRVQLCPSLTGIQCRRDGGFFEVNLDPSGAYPPRSQFHPIAWPTRVL